ncbi:hypothetical protein [Flavobacterium sp. 14A]|uniref:hypothetical protein n=1 Tax=Flavobacterium sp. 14A TaxID=2735896 RepID=UPI00156D9EA5|nr:hypothetical protein [Flavobacterium sp. 14A]NRT11539.1 uncharacterized protein YcfL [Flavobacterium sp. 14A]
MNKLFFLTVVAILLVSCEAEPLNTTEEKTELINANTDQFYHVEIDPTKIKPPTGG